MKERDKNSLLLGYNQFLCAETLANGDRFSLSLFEDFNKLVESVVLYDKIVLLGDYSIPSGLLATPLTDAGVLQTLSNDDMRKIIAGEAARKRLRACMLEVFGNDVTDAEEARPEQVLKRRISPTDRDRRAYAGLFERTIRCGRNSGFDRNALTTWIEQNVSDTRATDGSFYYFARAVLYNTIAEETGMDYAPDLLRLPVAALTFTRETRPLPRALYDALVAEIRSEVDALALLGMPVAVFVPPLTATLLSRAERPENYPNELMTLRDKFAGYREAYAEFRAMIRDPDATLRQKIDAKKKMITRISGIIKSGESRHALNVKIVWDKLIASSLDDSGVSTKVSLSGLVSLLIDQLSKERAKGEARALFDLWTDTMNLKDYGRMLEKTFKAKIDPAEVGSYKKYSAAIRKLIAAGSEPASG